MIHTLNRLAVEGLVASAGTYRTVPMTIKGSNHIPPDWQDVARHVDEMCDHVNGSDGSAVHLAAYVMWRLNWIHPFEDGNGRTTRAVSHLVMCARLGYELPGTKTIPDIISEDKQGYYDALDAADEAWKDDRLDVAVMEGVLQRALDIQLGTVLDEARAPTRPPAAGEVMRPSLPSQRRDADSRFSQVRKSIWTDRPRWLRALYFVVLFLVTGGWQLLTHWENPTVEKVRGWLVSQFQNETEPPSALPETSE